MNEGTQGVREAKEDRKGNMVKLGMTRFNKVDGDK